MIPVSLVQLAEILQAELIHPSDITIENVTTDTRNVPLNSLFIALKGERFDAHDFAEQAIKQGALALLVERELPFNIPQVIVKDSRIALGQLAHWVRMQVPAKVVALTGSSGKTSVKEMTAAILSQCGKTLYTAGNLNNDIGVPLTLLRLTKEYQFAVIELGANHIGEIAYTVNLAQPETALVNNLAAAHLEGFGSLEGVAQAKGEIFNALPENGTAIINLASNDWSNWQKKLTQQNIWKFDVTAQPEANFYASEIKLTQTDTEFRLHSPIGDCRITLPLLGEHNIANAIAASALAISVGADLKAVEQGLASARAVPGRLFPVPLNNSQLILDDTYNANVGSMSAAAHVLAQMPGYRVMVVGDMGELGQDAERCHRQVGEVIHALNIDKVFSVGMLSQNISQASGHGQHFTDKAAVVVEIMRLLQEHQSITILIKGSRSAAMEQIIQAVQEKLAC